MPKLTDGIGSKNGLGAEEDSEDLPGADETIVLPEQALVDQESDVADTGIRKLTTSVPPATRASTSAKSDACWPRSSPMTSGSARASSSSAPPHRYSTPHRWSS